MPAPVVQHSRDRAPLRRSNARRGRRSRPSSKRRRAVTTVTADSTPARYAVVRSPWTAPTLLVTAAGAAAGVYGVLPDASPAYRTALGALGGPAVIGPTGTGTRILVGILVALIATMARGTWSRRLLSAVTAMAIYIALIVVHDVAAGWWSHLSHAERMPATQMLQPLVAATLSLIGTVFVHYRLPPAVAVDRRPLRTRPGVSFVLFSVTGVVAMATYATFFALSDEPSLFLRSVPVIVLSAGVLPFSLAQTPLLYWLGRRAVRQPRTQANPSVAVLIPALDEAEHIGRCLASIERAASRYAGRCCVIVVDNASRDGTADIAARCLRRSATLRGLVLGCHEPGKSRALNTGLRHITDDLVLRVDADTIIGEDAIRLLVAHFVGQDVGAAGGLPLPIRTDTWIGRMRQIEVQLNIAIRRVAHNAVQSVMCLPGNVAMYRRDLLEQLGGFAEGINGEDTDITLRIARSGFRIVVDPQVEAMTAVPATLGELREQRIRWARAGYHVASRNRGLIRFAEGPIGFWYFPIGILAIHTRVLLLPLFVGMVAAAAEGSGDRVSESLDLIAAATAVRLVLAAIVLIVVGEHRAVPWLAGYIPFRMIVLFHSLESFLTLPLRGQPTAAAMSSALDVASPSRDRQRRDQRTRRDLFVAQ